MRKGISEFSIFPVLDRPGDSAWILSLLGKSGSFDFAVSGNKWVRSCFRSGGLPIVGHPFLERRTYSGTRIRKLIRAGDPSWKGLVCKGSEGIVERIISG